MNQVVLVGNVGQEPEVRTTSDGTKVVNLSLATNYVKNGEKKVSWHRITLWRALAETAEAYVGKGSLIGIAGYIEYRTYEVDGQTKYSTDVVARELKLLGPNPMKVQAAEEVEEAQAEVPF